MAEGNSFGGAENPLVKNVGAEITCWHDEVYFLLFHWIFQLVKRDQVSCNLAQITCMLEINSLGGVNKFSITMWTLESFLALETACLWLY